MREGAINKVAPLNPLSGDRQCDATLSDEATALSAALSDHSFMAPHYVTASGWIGHDPFAFWLVGALRPRTFVELGTHHGFSYFAVCQAVQSLALETRCYAVDHWKGDDHAGTYDESVFRSVKRRNDTHYSAFSHLVRSSFDKAVSHFDDASIDLLHIDGRHYYEDVKHDFETWFPKLSERGVVLFHDTNVRERGFGVHRYWMELSERYPSFELTHAHGLGVLAVGNSLPERLQIFLQCAKDPHTAHRIRSIYARLGALTQLRSEVEKNEHGATNLQHGTYGGNKASDSGARDDANSRQRLTLLERQLEQVQQDLHRRQEQLEIEKLNSATLQRCLTELEGQLEKARQDVRRYERDHELSRRQLADAHAAYRNSTSWKLTAPLRKVRTLRSKLGRFIRPAGDMLRLPAATKFRIAPQRSRDQSKASSIRLRVQESASLTAHNRILYFSHNLEWQGAQNSLLEIAKGVGERGTFVPLVMSPADGPMREAFEENGIPASLVRIDRHALMQKYSYVSEIERLERAIASMRPALVHVNTLQSYPAIIAAKRLGLPVLLNVRESEDPTTYYDNLPQHIRKKAYETYLQADQIIFVSDTTRQQWIKSLPNRQYNLVYNGLDVSRLAIRTYGKSRMQLRLKYDLSDSDVLILLVGTVTERKGQMDLLNAIKTMSSSSKRRAVFHIFGMKQSDYSFAFEEGCRALISDGDTRIRLHAESQSEDAATIVAENYLAADVFVMCSRVESYPRTILEAMSQSLPVVTTNCFGAKEMVKEGETGFFYEAGKHADLANILTRIINDETMRQNLGMRSRQRFDRLPNYRDMIAAYEDTYRTFIA